MFYINLFHPIFSLNQESAPPERSKYNPMDELTTDTAREQQNAQYQAAKAIDRAQRTYFLNQRTFR